MTATKTYIVAIVVKAKTDADLPTPQSLIDGINDGLPDPWFDIDDGEDFCIDRMVSHAEWSDLPDFDPKD